MNRKYSRGWRDGDGGKEGTSGGGFSRFPAFFLLRPGAAAAALPQRAGREFGPRPDASALFMSAGAS